MLQYLKLVFVPGRAEGCHRILQSDGLETQHIRRSFHNDEVGSIAQTESPVNAEQGFTLGVKQTGDGVDVFGRFGMGADIPGRISDDASPFISVSES